MKEKAASDYRWATWYDQHRVLSSWPVLVTMIETVPSTSLLFVLDISHPSVYVDKATSGLGFQVFFLNFLTIYLNSYFIILLASVTSSSSLTSSFLLYLRSFRRMYHCCLHSSQLKHRYCCYCVEFYLNLWSLDMYNAFNYLLLRDFVQ